MEDFEDLIVGALVDLRDGALVDLSDAELDRDREPLSVVTLENCGILDALCNCLCNLLSCGPFVS